MSSNSSCGSSGRQRYFSVALGLLLTMDYELLQEPSMALDYVTKAVQCNSENNIYLEDDDNSQGNTMDDNSNTMPGKERKMSLEESLIWLFDGEDDQTVF